MYTTPKQSDDLNRSNPYITTGISKSLLSRCPRVGLSRKRTPKTPGSAPAPLIDVEATPPTSKKEIENLEPKEDLKVEKRNKVSKRLLLKEDENDRSLEIKAKSVLKVDDNDSDEDNLNLTNFINKKQKSPDVTIKKSTSVEMILKECIKSDKEVIKSTKQDNNGTDFQEKGRKKLSKCQKTEEIPKNNRNKDIMNTEPQLEMGTKRIRKRPRRFFSEDENNENANESVSPLKPENGASTSNGSNPQKAIEDLKSHTKSIINDSVDQALKSTKKVYAEDKEGKSPKRLKDIPMKDENIMNTKSEGSTKRKRARHILSEGEDEDSEIATLTKLVSPPRPKTSPLKPKNEANIGEKSPELLVLKTNDKPLKTYRKPAKMKRSLSLKKTLSCRTDDEEFDDLLMQDCLVSLSPLESAASETDIGDIDTLEKQVMEKRKILDELKQAEIYQKKHDVKQLEELTGKYKEGCIEALRDLQKHANTDTTILLNQLGVPEELISTTDID